MTHSLGRAWARGGVGVSLLLLAGCTSLLGDFAQMPIPISGTVRAIGSDGSFVYGSNTSTILRGTGDLSQTTQNLGTGVSGTIYTHIAFDTNYAYVSDDSQVSRILKIGGPVVPLTGAFAVEAPNIIVPDPDDTLNRLYFAALDPTSYLDQTVWQVAKDGSNTTATAFASLASGVHPTAVAADPTAVYWADDAGEVWKVVK